MSAFLLYTVVFLIAGNFALGILYRMTQSGQALDMAFGWQKMLERLYGSTNKWKNLAGKALGDCEQCMAHWFMPAWYLLYYTFFKLVLNCWVTDKLHNWLAIIAINFIWLSVFWALGSKMGHITLIKFNKK